MADGDFSPPLTPAPAAPTSASTAPAAAAVPAPAPAPAPVAAATQAQTGAPAPAPSPAPASAAGPTPAAVFSEAPPAAAATPPVEAAPPTLLQKFDKEKADQEAAKAKEPTGATPPAGVTGATAAAANLGASGAGATAAAPSPAPALAAVEYKYALPQSMKLDDAGKAELHKAFDDFRANPAEGAQALINLHEQRVKELASFMLSEQRRIFNETRAQWAKDVLKDPEMGGAGHETAMGAVARMRDMFVPEKDRAEFEKMLVITGAGDHPAFLRMLHQAARFYDEPGMPPPNPRPPPDVGKRPGKSRFREMYDHPRSNGAGQ